MSLPVKDIISYRPTKSPNWLSHVPMARSPGPWDSVEDALAALGEHIVVEKYSEERDLFSIRLHVLLAERASKATVASAPRVQYVDPVQYDFDTPGQLDAYLGLDLDWRDILNPDEGDR